MLNLEYLTHAAVEARLAGSPVNLLGIIGFPSKPARHAAVPSSSVGLHGEEAAICEVWAGAPAARYGKAHGVQYATSGDLLFGAISAPEAEGALSLRAEDVYGKAFALMEELGYPHALRFWNYVPRLNELEQGLERYRAFNLGRHAAFEAAGRLRPESIPAACALGTRDDVLSVYFLASRLPGRPIENPRQVEAWRYPEEYGPQSPTFARGCAYPASAPQMLFVSGTASIVGHRTVHLGDVVAQTRETLANLGAVFAEARRLGDFPMQAAQYKAYVRHATDIPAVRRELLAGLGGHADIALLCADICRAELLVEVEAFCRSSPPVSV